MASVQNDLTATYSQLSSLYKNPTRNLSGVAASDLDAVLAQKRNELAKLFEDLKPGPESALYLKILALLYEVDDYLGRTPSVEQTILKEPTASVEHFKTRDPEEQRKGLSDKFTDPAVRSLWKAKVRCCVAAIESRRKNSHPEELLAQLDHLESFVFGEMHAETLPAWTTLAFVRVAQARIARQGRDLAYVQNKLVSVVECLDKRAAEVIDKTSELLEKLTELTRAGESTLEVENQIRDLEDDLIFIKQKQTLAIPFNIGLGNLQRGLLDSANRACQTAKFQFRLHGQASHRLHNELLMIAIRRARTSTEDKLELQELEEQLVREILPKLEPKGLVGRPKLYLYALRELAVIQHLSGKFPDMRATLRKMESVSPLGPQWESRINLLRARAAYGSWRQVAGDLKNKDHRVLLQALRDCNKAFRYATGGRDRIEDHADVLSLLASIKGLGNRNLIDTMESLITYGTAQLFLKNYFDAVKNRVEGAQAVREAMKSAEAVKELSKHDNPRLLAMAHLVLADAHRESNFIVEARQHLEHAKSMEAQIQHEYVKDRRKAVEAKLPKTLTLYLETCGHIDRAEDLVLGWYIGNCVDKSSIYKIAQQLVIGVNRIRKYIARQGPSSPYFHLLTPTKKSPSSTKKAKKKTTPNTTKTTKKKKSRRA